MEEDLFVVIVGDPPVPELPNNFKFEPDEDLNTVVPVKDILEKASWHVETSFHDEIKQEPEDSCLDEGSQTDHREPQHERKIKKRKKKSKNKKPAPPRDWVLADDLRAADVQSICPVCEKEFPNVSEMQIHTSTVHKDLLLPFKCTHCTAAYPHVIALKRHVKVQHSGIKYICDICNRVCNKKDNLIMHMNTHTSIKRFPCEYCPKAFAKKFNLNLHKTKFHNTSPPQFVCDICPNKRFFLMSDLTAHMKKEHGLTLMTNTHFLNKLPTMTEEQLKNVKIITKEEMEKARLKTENLPYEEEKVYNDPHKKFVCELCPKRYYKLWDLNLHVQRQHKKEPPTCACEICGKRYHIMSQVKHHMKIKHGVFLMNKKNFLKKLPTLDQTMPNARILSKEEFQQFSDIIEQDGTEGRELITIMEYPCTRCEKTFDLKEELKKHIEIEHLQAHLPVTCQVCNKECKSLISLNHHMKRQHNLIILTKEKFEKALPKLTKEQIEEAKVVLKPTSLPIQDTVDEVVV